MYERENGYVLIIVLLLSAAMCGVAAIAVDISVALWNQRVIHSAADAGAQAGVKLLGTSLVPNTLNARIDQEARLIAQANNINPGEITGVQCGTWNTSNKTFTPCVPGCANCLCQSCVGNFVNAVNVLTKRDVTTYFAKIFQFNLFNLALDSVAVNNNIIVSDCNKPFGIGESSIYNNYGTPQESLAVQIGSNFTIGKGASGNWGKIDLGGNNSSADAYQYNIINGVCSAPIAIGAPESPGTGFAGVSEGFKYLLDHGLNTNLKLVLTSNFTNGNSDIIIKEFIIADFISQSGNGNGWQGTFKLKAVKKDPTNLQSYSGGPSLLVY